MLNEHKIITGNIISFKALGVHRKQCATQRHGKQQEHKEVFRNTHYWYGITRANIFLHFNAIGMRAV